MRYFISLQYNGNNYSGWQRQPNAMTVQEIIENSLSALLRERIELIGCGRTDAGVHASQYYAHFEHGPIDEEHLSFKLDQMVGEDIRIVKIFPVEEDAHARFSAERRSYYYYISGSKQIFNQGFYWHFPLFHKVDWGIVGELAALLQEYEEFKPFCKSNSGLDTFKCLDLKNKWTIDPQNNTAIYFIESNRFLRGMVRLLVGTSMYVGTGKLTLDQVRTSLNEQSPIVKAYSAPPEGLFLSMIKYPFIENSPEAPATNWV